MKTKLNILCTLIFVAIIVSFVNYCYNNYREMTWSFMRGVEQGYESTQVTKKTDPKEYRYLDIEPLNISRFTDSIYNDKTQQWVPMQYKKIVIEENVTTLGGWEMFGCGLMVVFISVSFLCQMFAFVFLMISLNNNVIFDWKNVFKLRFIGYAMLVSFVANAIFTYIHYTDVLTHVSIPGYMLKNFDMWNFSLLLPGLGVLLIAEIFAVGLRLKEEQDLTV